MNTICMRVVAQMAMPSGLCNMHPKELESRVLNFGGQRLLSLPTPLDDLKKMDTISDKVIITQANGFYALIF